MFVRKKPAAKLKEEVLPGGPNGQHPSGVGGLAFVRSPRHMLTQTIQLQCRVSTPVPLQH